MIFDALIAMQPTTVSGNAINMSHWMLEFDGFQSMVGTHTMMNHS